MSKRDKFTHAISRDDGRCIPYHPTHRIALDAKQMVLLFNLLAPALQDGENSYRISCDVHWQLNARESRVS